MKLLPIAVALALLVPSAFPARAIDLAGYRAQLAKIDGFLARGDRKGAAALAKGLIGEKIVWEGETLQADETVLGPIAAGSDPVRRTPLRVLLAALESVTPPAEGSVEAADAQALESIRARQNPEEIAKGGRLPGVPEPPATLREKFSQLLDACILWIGKRLSDLWDWLWKLWPHSEGRIERSGGSGFQTLIFAIVGAILVAVLALAVRAIALSRRKPALSARAAAPAPDADADPLSRSSGEWEDRARSLAAEGRFREAIRAWYHALLVNAFRAGVLHHRRGNTNREYARSLSPEVPYRATFGELTDRFDLEWYGRPESTPESLEVFAQQSQLLLAQIVWRAP
jgi:hypothetical protein